MRTDIAYEVTDLRKTKKWELGPVGILRPIPGGLYLDTYGNRYHFLDLTGPDEDAPFTDRWEEGIVEIHTSTGLIQLTRLRLANYLSRVYPYVDGNPGPFESDDTVNAYFYRTISEAGMN